MENKLSRLFKTNSETVPAPEITVEPTPKPKGPRIMVFGSRLSGSVLLGTGLYEYLKEHGIENPEVRVERDGGYLRNGFYGIYRNDDGSIPEETIPTGVILLPEMRQYSESGIGMSFPTYESKVPEILEELCEEHDIPLIRIYENYTLEESTAALAPLLLKDPISKRSTS